MSFDRAFEKTVGLEGGYSNNPKDRGGPTKFGITERVARANGYKDDMRDMPMSVAKAIYLKQYWDQLNLDSIGELNQQLAEEMFDKAVNLGVGTVAKFLQRSLNVLNRGQRDYPDLAVDGVLGPVTVYDMKLLVQRRGSEAIYVISNMLKAMQVMRYVEIAERDPSQEEFAYGWLSKRVGK